MSCITYFSPTLCKDEIPGVFPSPFHHKPHPLAVKAASYLQKLLSMQNRLNHDFYALDGGKMFGVLVVRDVDGRLGYLCAFSGMLAGKWQLPGFVPPIFDEIQRDEFLPAGEKELENFSHQIERLTSGTEKLKLQRQLNELQEQQQDELLSLKELHRKRKLDRQFKRHLINKQIPCDADQALAVLSFESQQDKKEKKELIAKWGDALLFVQQKIQQIEAQLDVLKKSRLELSRSLHERVFSSYILSNVAGDQVSMGELFAETLPPGGAGDCAAPKLIHYATQHKLKPVALAEFWWGASPASSIRRHGHYYPACRGKCYPILPFMLKGVSVEPDEMLGDSIDDKEAPSVVYEDEFLLVVNKPCGLLSVPGKEIQDSVLYRLQQRYPEASGPLLVHRLDLATSGLLLAAKNENIHKALQKQFMDRQIKKRYVALLSKCPAQVRENNTVEGIIDLPMRVDLDDRPRQVVCYQHGKSALTQWRIVANDIDKCRINFYPVTGRTHQLRVHAAHPEGLNAPIVGDNLYGEEAERLYLHAESLCFIHPVSGESMTVEAPAPF